MAMLAGFSSFAQSANEIVKKHNEAIGGEAAWARVTSLKLIGAVTMDDNEMTGSETILNGKGMRLDFSSQGQSGYFLLTPTKGWVYLPNVGLHELPAELVAGSTDRLNVLDDLMAGAKNEKMAFAGKEQIDGKDVLKLTGTDSTGAVTTYYIDATTYYLVRTTDKQKDESGKDIDAIENYSNFKKLPEGIVVAMTQVDDEVKLVATTAEVNNVKDESIFQPTN